jgi:5-methylcytosine-specific restriction protein A
LKTSVKAKDVRYQSCFECISWDQRRGKDKTGADRSILVFHLLPTRVNHDSAEQPASESARDTMDPAPKTPRTLDELRDAAYAAGSTQAPKSAATNTKRTWYERSKAVKDYVLARAKSYCEACDTPAPFKKADQTPYLEPHHTHRLADDGPDHPAWVGAICPNCHRRIHSGEDGKAWNERLQKRLWEKEEGATGPTLAADDLAATT